MKKTLKDLAVQMLEEKGATIESMVDILVDLQAPYIPNISRKLCSDNILAVLDKREVQFAVFTGLEIDRLASEKLFRQPIQEIIENDFGLYGIDEIVALSITNVYGSIGLTNFGYLDKTKPGIIGKLDSKKEGVVCTFIDDIVCAIVAAAASRLAHNSTDLH